MLTYHVMPMTLMVTVRSQVASYHCQGHLQVAHISKEATLQTVKPMSQADHKASWWQLSMNRFLFIGLGVYHVYICLPPDSLS